MARTRFEDYRPLLGLKRFGEARALLRACRSVFERENDVQALGTVLSAFADLEDKTAGPAAARRFEEMALRYKYLARDPGGMAISHFNLASYIREGQGPPREALAHRLAAVLLTALMGPGRFEGYLQALAIHLADFGPQEARAALPADFAGLCAMVEQVEGVRFREAFDRLATPQQVTGDVLLQKVLEVALAILDHLPPPAPADG